MRGFFSVLIIGVTISLVSYKLRAQETAAGEKQSSEATNPPAPADLPPAAASQPSTAPAVPPSTGEEIGSQGGGYQEEGIAFQPSPEYTYDPNNRRDPFRPFGQAQVSPVLPMEPIDDGKPPKPGGPNVPPPNMGTPLQNYDIGQFKLLGIIWNVKNPKAVIRDPMNKQHILYRYTKIGRNNGFVAEIREGGVVIVEPSVGDNGMPAAVTRSLELKK